MHRKITTREYQSEARNSDLRNRSAPLHTSSCSTNAYYEHVAGWMGEEDEHYNRQDVLFQHVDE
jgi:hypothetical protein